MTQKFENALKTVEPQDTLTGSVIPSAYDIGLDDMAELRTMIRSQGGDAMYRALIMAFRYGFVMGNRATHSRNIQRL